MVPESAAAGIGGMRLKVTRLSGAVAVGRRLSVGTVEPLVKGLRRALVMSFQELTDLQTFKKKFACSPLQSCI
jgi:hypothetical protein